MCLAIPGKIIALLDNKMAQIDINGNMVEASAKLCPKAKAGDYVLLHAGFIMEIIDEELARETIEQFRQLPAF